MESRKVASASHAGEGRSIQVLFTTCHAWNNVRIELVTFLSTRLLQNLGDICIGVPVKTYRHPRLLQSELTRSLGGLI